jgi:hypothetical protein
MRHYREFNLQKNCVEDLKKILFMMSSTKFNGWHINNNLSVEFEKSNNLSDSNIIVFLSPFFKWDEGEYENKVFRGILYFGIKDNSLTIFDIIGEFEEKKLPVHLYNFILHEFINNVLNEFKEPLKDFIGNMKLSLNKPTLSQKPIDKKLNKYLAICKPEEYEIFNKRIKKPIHASKNNSDMLLQEAQELTLNNKQKIDYFTPNNISLLLSISEKSLSQAKLVRKSIITTKIKTREDKLDQLKNSTETICNFIELIQTSIVFSYTAIEAFANLSIPQDFEYFKIKKDSGVSLELKYNKDSIERLIPLKEKIKNVLPDIYDTKPIELEEFYSRLGQLESLRDRIIHQKTAEYIELYNDYFQDSIFKICKVSEEIINFFYEKCKNDFSTNPYWPWISSKDNIFPKSGPNSSFVSGESIFDEE